MAAGRPVQVYLDLLSQPCRAVYILLTCTKIPHKVHAVAEVGFRFGKRLKGGYLTRLFTCCSDAILKYLATQYDVPEHWYPRQPQQRARVDEYTAWHHTNTRAHAAKVFILEVLLPRHMGSAVDKVALNNALSNLKNTLDKLETMFLRRQPFLCGDDITVADLLAICELMQVRSVKRAGTGLFLSMLSVLSAASRSRAGHLEGPPTAAALEEPRPISCWQVI
uniref:glutathione transferase n=1 Tax=Nothobranchius furzeri TaxID=105023 RepID=A0A8C6PKL4_NOTFU